MGRPRTRAESTVAHRVATWRAFMAWLRPHSLDVGLTAAAPTDAAEVARWVRGFLASRMADRRWAAPTALNALGAIRISVSRLGWPHEEAAWSDARDQLQRLLPFHTRNQASPATAASVARLRALLPKEEADAVTLMWAMAARWSDLARAELRDVEEVPGGGWVVKLRLTKTTQAGIRGAFAAPIPEPQASALRRRKATASPHEPLIQSTYAETLRRVKEVYPALTLHSFRRGAVQALLDAGVPVDELRRMTGHVTEASLYGYADRLPPSAWAAAEMAAVVLF